jgi:hypothetical protein
MERVVQATPMLGRILGRTSGGLLVLAVAGMLATGPVVAASANVEAAIKSLAKVETDAAKFQAYCKLIDDMSNVPETDAAKLEDLEGLLEDLFESMGADVLQAWELASETDPASDDGKAFEAAFAALEDKCP